MTDEQKQEIEEIEQEIKDNPWIDEEAKKTLSEFRVFAKKFPKKVNKWKKIFKKHYKK